jgi:uncharacterized protein
MHSCSRRCAHSDVELHWPPSLPHGGFVRGVEAQASTWTNTWLPLQPTPATRRLDPRVVAPATTRWSCCGANGGLASNGENLDQPVLVLYEVRDARLVRAQRFYFDTADVVSFLARANVYGQAGCLGRLAAAHRAVLSV